MRQRVALGSAAFGLGVCVSYALLRLLALGEVEAGPVRNHTPYFWRLGLALLHGGVLGLSVALLAGEAERWLARLPAVLAVLVPGLALLMAVFP